MQRTIRTLVTVGLLGTAALAAGCKSDDGTMMSDKPAMSSSSDTMMPVVSADAGEKMMAAPSDGQYMLMVGGSKQPKTTVTLKKGQMVGFQSMNGKMMAVAGDKTYPLDGAGGAFWSHQKSH